jgi:hypothetical protein
MPRSSVSTEPESADPGTLPADTSVRSSKGGRDTGVRTIALVAGGLLAGTLVGTLVGTFLGIGIGNALRKRMDRLSPCY